MRDKVVLFGAGGGGGGSGSGSVPKPGGNVTGSGGETGEIGMLCLHEVFRLGLYSGGGPMLDVGVVCTRCCAPRANKGRRPTAAGFGLVVAKSGSAKMSKGRSLIFST